MGGRCMWFEVVLQAYRRLRWDVDVIRRVGHTFASDFDYNIFTETASVLVAPNAANTIHDTLTLAVRLAFQANSSL